MVQKRLRCLWWVFLSVCVLSACGDDDASGGASSLDTGVGVDAAEDVDVSLPDMMPDTAISDAGGDLDVEDDAAAVDPNDPGMMMTPTQEGLTASGASTEDDPAQGAVRAGRVESGRGGFDGEFAGCGEGDFVLVNSESRFCVEGQRSNSNIFFDGGRLVDAIGKNSGKDRLDVMSGFTNLLSPTAESVEMVRDGTAGPLAVVRVSGELEPVMYIAGLLGVALFPVPPVSVVTEYRLAPDRAVLEIVTFLRYEGAGTVVINIGDIIFWGDTMTGVSLGGEDGVLLMSAGEGVNYGWLTTDPMTPLLLPGVDLPAEMLTLPGEVMSGDETRVVQRFMAVGKDPAEVMESLTEISPAHPSLSETVQGTVRVVRMNDEPVVGARVKVSDAEDDSVTWYGVTDETGRVEVRVKASPLLLEVGLEEEEVVETTWSLPTSGEEKVVVVSEGVLVRVRVEEIGDGGEGKAIPAKIWFKREDGSQRILRFVLPGETLLRLPSGPWLWEASRGVEYTCATGSFDGQGGEEVALTAELEHVLPTPGFISGEFHQHASPSLDSETSLEERVMANAVEGVDFAVSTDHDMATDFGPVVELLGLEGVLATMVGAEVSPLFGHFGTYPLTYESDATARGALPLAYKTSAGVGYYQNAASIFEAIRMRGEVLIQVNHPRGSTGYFESYNWDGVGDVGSASEGFSMDFDTLEVVNGKRLDDTPEVLRDWYSLLNQGYRVVGLGNSDTHSKAAEAGWPRNYLPGEVTTPAEITDELVKSGLESGDVVVSAGGYLELVAEAQAGEETVRPGQLVLSETLTVEVKVWSPPWSELKTLRLVRNGVTVETLQIGGGQAALVDFDGPVVLETSGEDAWFHLIACGDRSQRVYPGKPVFAFSNPYYLDGDGDGVFTAPGDILEEGSTVFCE